MNIIAEKKIRKMIKPNKCSGNVTKKRKCVHIISHSIINEDENVDIVNHRNFLAIESPKMFNTEEGTDVCAIEPNIITTSHSKYSNK